MKISARNQLPGRVVSISEGAVNAVVSIEIAPGLVIQSMITRGAVEELGLAVGREAVAVIKASSVLVALEG